MFWLTNVQYRECCIWADFYKQHKNPKHKRLKRSIDFRWNEADLKCTSHREGASKQRPSGQIQPWHGTKRPVTQLHTRVFLWKRQRIRPRVTVWFHSKTTLEHNLRKKFFQQNKISKPAIMEARFPLRAPVDFCLFPKHPYAPRHIKYEYGSIDRRGRAIRALQSPAPI